MLNSNSNSNVNTKYYILMLKTMCQNKKNQHDICFLENPYIDELSVDNPIHYCTQLSLHTNNNNTITVQYSIYSRVYS